MVSNGVSIFELIDQKCAAAAAPSSSPAAAGAPLYVYVDGGRPGGPLSAADLSAKLGAGSPSPDTPVWTSALPRWTPAREVAELGVAAAPPSAAPEKPVDCSGGVAVYDEKFADDLGGFPRLARARQRDQGRVPDQPVAEAGELGGDQHETDF